MMVSMANLWIWLVYSFFLSRCLVYNYLCHCSSQDFVFYYPIYQSRSKLDTDKLDIQYCKYKLSLSMRICTGLDVCVCVCGCVHGYIKLGEDMKRELHKGTKELHDILNNDDRVIISCSIGYKAFLSRITKVLMMA